MLYHLRISIYYAVAISLLAGLYFFLFSKPVLHPPVYYLADGLVVYSEAPQIPAGSRLAAPYCSLADSETFICSLRDGNSVRDIILPGTTFNFAELLRLFSAPVLGSFLVLFFAVWFLDTSRDILISSFFFWLTAFLLSTQYTIVYGEGIVPWIILGYLVPITLLNLNLRISGRTLNARLLISESVLLLFLSLLALAAEGSAILIEGAVQIMCYAFWTMTAISAVIQLMAALDPDNDDIDRLKKIVALAGTLLGVALPVVLLMYFPGVLSGFFYMLLLTILPLSLIYGTYRMHVVPFQFFVTRSIAAALLTFVFLTVYAVVLYLYSIILPETETTARWIINSVFLLLLVFFLDPWRTRISSAIEKRFLLPRGEHSESLKRLAEIISRSSRPRVAVQAILDEINQTLGLQCSFFLTVPDFFFYLDLTEQHVLRLSTTSPIWNLLRPEKIYFTSYLNYGTGARKELFEFLYERKVLLAIGLGKRRNLLQRIHTAINRRRTKTEEPPENLSCALLVGYPKDRDRLYLRELRYLQEAARLAGMMLYNMHTLIREVDKRKKVRDLHQSGQYQKIYTLNPDAALDILDYRYFNRPVLSVTGDYIDVIRLPFHRTAIFLGDVSGHGLGTGFLVSALRSIVRTAIDAQKSLPEVLGILNEFLTDRYSGYEFLTLFAMILNHQDGRMEYINAAHPGAYLKLPGGPLEKLENTQRLLGILPGPYRSYNYRIKPGQRIFLFSDGVIETVNREEQFFGENRLAEFLTAMGDEPLDDIVQGLQNTLQDFRGNAPAVDDTSFLVLEYLPARSLLDFVLRGLGIRR